MKNYQHQSTDMLQLERTRLMEEIAGWENTLVDVKSALIIRYLNYAIKQAKEKIHVIEAELCYREHN